MYKWPVKGHGLGWLFSFLCVCIFLYSSAVFLGRLSLYCICIPFWYMVPGSYFLKPHKETDKICGEVFCTILSPFFWGLKDNSHFWHGQIDNSDSCLKCILFFLFLTTGHPLHISITTVPERIFLLSVWEFYPGLIWKYARSTVYTISLVLFYW